MSFDAGGLAQMTYNNSNSAFPPNGFGNPGSGFGNRSRLNAKKLSVALPPTVNPISENQVDNPTPRTSRSHLLAGLRTQPKTPATPVSAPFNNTQAHGFAASQWGNQSYDAYDEYPSSAPGFDLANHYGMNAGRQMYSLPQQVLAPPSLCEQNEEMDPAVLQQMQLTSLYLAQRQQQLQQQLANLTASAQGLNLNGFSNSFGQSPLSPQTPQNTFGQQQMQSPIEVPGQPGVYLVYNSATQGYNYITEQQLVALSSAQQQQYASSFSTSQNRQPPTPTVSVTPPATERPGAARTRSYTPPKLVNPLENGDVEPLPPPSSTAYRRGHKKASSLFINSQVDNVNHGAKSSSSATFGSQRSVFPAPPMTGTFGPGAARAGDHPVRQPRGPPPLEELTSLPTTKHEGSKNFATRQRRRALDSLVRAGTSRRGLSRSSNGSPVSDRDYYFPLSEDTEDDIYSGSSGSRKMSPIGTEMKEKRGSQGSSDGYFGLSSASSSESEDAGLYKQPPTPATPIGGNGDRKMMLAGVLHAANAAEKRRSGIAY